MNMSEPSIDELLVAADRKLAASRAAREQAEEALREIEMECGNPDPSDGEGTSPQDVVNSVGGLKKRVEQAEARLAEAMTLLRELVRPMVQDQFPGVLSHLSICSFQSGDPADCHICGLSIRAYKFLMDTAPPPILAELERLRRLEKHQQQFPVLDAKWLDPECHDGCQSLVFKDELAALKLKLEVARGALTELTEPKGAFRKDPLEHARNIIEDSIKAATEALVQLNESEEKKCTHEWRCADGPLDVCSKCGVTEYCDSHAP